MTHQYNTRSKTANTRSKTAKTSPHPYNTRSKKHDENIRIWIDIITHEMLHAENVRLWKLCVDMYEHLINCGVIIDSKANRDLVKEKREELEFLINGKFTYEFLREKLSACESLIGLFMKLRWVPHLVQF
jgi:hypothetical protein